ncbi:MAG: hypothetical protein R3E66_23685 [bacterium]
MRKALVCLFVGFVAIGLASCGDDTGKTKESSNNTGTNNVANNVNNVATNNGSNNGTTNNTNGGNNSSNNSDNLVGGRITLPLVGFGDPKVLYTPEGVAHVVFHHGAGPAYLVYGECAANCGVETNWTFVDLATGDLVGDTRMKSDASGRLHVVYTTSPIGAGVSQTLYTTCASNCTNANNWRTVDLTPALDNTWSVYRGSPLAVSPDGAVYLVTTDGSYNARVFLTQCLGGCDDGRNWSAGQIRQGGSRTEMAVDGTTLHQVLSNEGGGLVYRTCAGNCTDAQNWQESAQLFAFDGNAQVRLAVSNGELRLAYNQGFVSDESAQVTAQNGRILYWTCSSNCLDPTGWSGTLLANPKDGEHLDMVAIGDATVLAFAADNLDYQTMVCLGNCLDPASWTTATIDSTEAMGVDFDPFSLMCGSDRPYFAAWYVESPSVAISETTGEGLFASAGSLLRKCSVTGDFAKLNGMGRLTLLE